MSGHIQPHKTACFTWQHQRVSLLSAGVDKTSNSDNRPTSANKPTLGQCFFNLPVEIQLQILNLMSLSDLLNIRKTNRQFRHLTIANESYLVNTYIRTNVPTFIVRLFPPIKKTPTLRYVAELATKQRVACNLSYHLAEQVTKEMIGRRRRKNMDTELKARTIRRLRRGMAPLVFMLLHFFESYTAAKLQRFGRVAPHPLCSLSADEGLKLQSDILAHYPDSMLLLIHQMYNLLLHMLFRRFSPPPRPILGHLGRWNSHRPNNAAFAKVLVYGGIKEVARLYRIQGYGRRRRTLDKYVQNIDSERASRFRLNCKPSDPTTAKLAHMDVDNLTNLWTPAAEEQLLARGIVEDLDEVKCYGRFVSTLLATADEVEDQSDDEDEEDSDDDDDDDTDSEDDEYY
jgi:hypothetical protein